MEVVKKDLGKLNAELAVKIEEKDYKEQVDKALRNYRKQANLPGFRKGMVPMGMVKKMVGTNILAEEINKVLSDSLYKYIGDEKLDILGNPIPVQEGANIDWDTQKSFEFKYEIGLAPEIKISLSDKDKFELYKIKASDKMVEEQVEEIAKRYGKMIDTDKSAEEDMLYGKFEELKGGRVKEGGISHGTVINLRTIDNKKELKKLLGLKVGDVVTMKPQNIAKPQYVSAWLGIQKEEVEGIASEFQYTIEKVQRMEAAEINQELLDKLYGKDTVKSKEEMKKKIAEEMEKSLEQTSAQFFERDIQDHLIKKAKLELPDEFMKKWLLTANEKPITKEQVEEEYEQYATGLKWQLIENKLLKENNIEVKREEIVDYTKNLVSQQLAGMGQNLMEDKELEETANRVLQNQEEARRLYEQLYQVKLRKLYKDTVKIKEKEIGYDDFVKLAEKRSKK